MIVEHSRDGMTVTVTVAGRIPPRINWDDGSAVEQPAATTEPTDSADGAWTASHLYTRAGNFRIAVQAEVRARIPLTLGEPLRAIGGVEQRRRNAETEDTTMIAATRSRLG